MLPHKFLVLSLAAFSFFLLANCSTKEVDSHPVSLHSGFTMPQLLDNPKEIKKQGDLPALLNETWYVPVPVVGAKLAKTDALSNCNEYFANKTKSLRTKLEHENNAFLELIVMCEATQILIQAKNSTYSYIPEKALSTEMPSYLPANLAMQTSPVEEANNKHLLLWKDINQNFNAKIIDKDKVEFIHDSGVQEMSLVGRGDFNNDGTEDLLISSRDSVKDGSYFNIRLFTISIDKQGQWQLTKQ